MRVSRIASAVTVFGLLLAVAPLRAELILDDPALEGYWMLDEPAGTAGAASVLDSKDGSHGTPTGAVTFGQAGATALSGSSVVLGGGSARIDVPYAAAINPTPFTIEGWVRAEGGAGTYRAPISNRRYDGTYTRGFNFYATSGNAWSFWTGGGTASWRTTGGPSVIDGQWIHLAGVMDTATSTQTFYVNGTPVGTTSNTTFMQNDSATTMPLRLGGNAEGGAAFPGSVDNVAMFSAALGAQTVRNHYNSFSPYASRVLSDAPAAYWRLGEQSGGTAYDAVGTRKGTYQNGAAIRQIGDTPLTGDVDTGVDFDGVNDDVMVPFDAGLHTTTFSVEMWAKVEGGENTWRSPIMARGGSPPTAPYYGTGCEGYNIYASQTTDANGDNTWQFWTGVYTGWQSLQGPAVEMDEWTHLVATFEPTSGPDADGVYTGIKRFYVNGQPTITTSAQYKPATVESPAFLIGGGPRFNGKLDEVAYYHRAVGVDEIAAHYATAKLGAFGNPQADLPVYHFDEGAGTTARDASLYEADGTFGSPNAPSWAPGLFGNALSFEDHGDHVAVTTFPAGSYSQLTVEAWVKLGSQQGRNEFINEQSGNSLWMNIDTSDNHADFDDAFDVYLGDTTFKGYHSTYAAIPRGEWAHLAFTYDDDVDELKLYVNGQLDRTITTGGTINLDSTVLLGKRESNSDSTSFKGLLDEVAFYSRALSGDEILARFGAGPPLAFVPEPGTLVLLGLGGLGLVLWGRRRR